MPWTDDRVEQLKRMVRGPDGQPDCRPHRPGRDPQCGDRQGPSPRSVGAGGESAGRHSPSRRARSEPNLAARSSGLTVSGATALKPQFRPQPKPLPLPEPEPIRLVEVPSGEQRCSIMHLTDPAGGRSAIRRARISASAVARLAKEAPIAVPRPDGLSAAAGPPARQGARLEHDVAQVRTPVTSCSSACFSAGSQAALAAPSALAA